MSRAQGRTTDRAALVFSTIVIVLGLAWLLGIYLVFFPNDWIGGEQAIALSYLGYDIDVFLGAASRFIEDGSLYAPEQIEAAFTPGEGQYFYYAPPFGLAVTPLAQLEASDSAAIWFGLKVLAMLAACLLMPVKLPVRALTFMALAVSFWVMRDLVLGNVGLLLLLPLALAWRWLDRPLGSVAAALAISVRPSLGAILIWQLLRRQWRVAAWTMGTGLVLILLSLPFVGIDGYLDYLKVLGNIEVPGAGSENRDLGSTAVALGLADEHIGLVRWASVALGLGLMVLSLRRDREVGYMIALASSLLLISQMWEFYLMTLALPLALLADRWRPVVLLVLVLSWLPSPWAPLVLLLTMGLLFVLPERRPLELTPDDLSTKGVPA